MTQQHDDGPGGLEMSRRVLLGGAALGGLALASGALTGATVHEAAAQTNGTRIESYALIVDGTSVAFPELLSLQTGMEPSELHVEGETYYHTLGLPKSSSVVLRRPLVAVTDGAGDPIWQWHQAARTRNIGALRPTFLDLLDRGGQIVMRYHLEGAMVLQIEAGPAADRRPNELFETVTVESKELRPIGS